MKINKFLSTSRVIIFGFLGVILLGTLFLMLPISSKAGSFTPFLDAFFTATSATCVTGLVVYDTATYWSVFGQGIILTLIQIGGLGVITVAVSIAIISGRKIGLMQRSTMQDSISAHQIGGIVKLTSFILKITFCIEALGAIIMMPVFVGDFGTKGIWLSFFHSISAFCNAGFDLMGNTGAEFVSLTKYAESIFINIVICTLIVVGGIGFLVWNDIKLFKLNFRKYSVQTKVVLVTTAILIILPLIYFYFVEFKDTPKSSRFVLSLFQAITPRTAGFNTVDLTNLSSIGSIITIFLMLIGGSPGSTAGGIKTTTLAMLIFSTLSVFRKKNDVECFGRRISDEVVKNAASLFIMYFVLFISGGILISFIEGIPVETCLFETASAIGTVGLSMGITPSLTYLSKIILIGLMFFGRIGGLTIIFAAVTPKGKNISKKPLGKITVG